MMTMIAEIYKHQNGDNFHSVLYCVDMGGSVVRSVTDTLLEVVSEMHASEIGEIEGLFLKAERGEYVPDNPDLPDWGVNDKFVWLGRSDIERGYILISNEYSEDFSSEFGTPQLFSMDQFRAAFKFWMEFQEICKLKGKESMEGEKVYGVL
ncbi:hypothetical protein [Pseudomonas gingeri]|uniref:Uncharacterized protein n=2 Tax=Pseudomonas gingeri TaxID=117681 RepID=A0A7Y8CNA3_9PSED|nr:hypothetical protein [Pseudomonas gingeri]NWB32093.1 hypothetical protein [Pseudomonas gingeri]NWC37132.1 hypothetical protein [Pseudomonas gingeri]